MNVIKLVGLLLICGVVAISMGSGAGNDSTPEPTLKPGADNDAAAVGEVMDGLQPIIVSSAGAVDTLAKLASPSPSFAEQWGNVLGAVCIVGLIVGACAFVAVAWLVFRSGVVGQIVAYLAVKKAVVK